MWHALRGEESGRTPYNYRTNILFRVSFSRNIMGLFTVCGTSETEKKTRMVGLRSPPWGMIQNDIVISFKCLSFSLSYALLWIS